MSLAFDIFQGLGIAAAVGIRPFLPGLAVGALAAGGVEIHFTHCSYSFLQDSPYLLVMVAGTVLLVLVERSALAPRLRSGPVSLLFVACSLIIGGMLFAGEFSHAHHPIWIGWVAGVICAAIGVAASRPFLERLRRRLDEAAAAVGLPLIAEGSAVVIAVLSVVAPPLGIVALLALLWLLIAGRRRSDQKYAGLRILR